MKFAEKNDDYVTGTMTIQNQSQNTKIIVNSEQFSDLEELDAKIMEHIEKTTNGKWMCNICEKIMAYRAHVKEHVEIHFDGLSFQCQHCTTVLRSRDSLRHHIRKRHKPTFK